MSDPNSVGVGGCCSIEASRGGGLGPWAPSWSTSPSALALMPTASPTGEARGAWAEGREGESPAGLPQVGVGVGASLEVMLSIEGPVMRDARPSSGYPHAFSVPTVCMCDY